MEHRQHRQQQVVQQRIARRDPHLPRRLGDCPAIRRNTPSISSSNRAANATSSTPAAVGTYPSRARSNTAVPNRASSPRSRRNTVEWSSPSHAAAAGNVRFCDTAWISRRSSQAMPRSTPHPQSRDCIAAMAKPPARH